MKFSADFLERLKASYSIVDVISPFVTLQRRGRSFWGCCPFHNEKTPSFSVDEVRGIYKCFGCGKGGNHFRFLMDYKNMTFAEAVQYVAEKAHIPMPVAEESEAERRARRQRETGYECLLEAARFYRDKLFDGSCPEIKAYLDGRNLDERTVKVFGLGASPDYDSLIKHLAGKGFSSETMLYCGVAQKSNHGLYDPLAKRLIIPIINAAGKVIGFGGRVLQKTDMAKYKNTIATPIFEKRYNLYGMNIFAKQRSKEAIIVEGYFDLISLYQAGITNAIAPMGTSLTDRQCDILKKYDVKIVYVCFDGDSAGQHATLRSLSMLSERGMEVKVVTIPDDMDPDDAVKKMGREGFLALMDSARPLIDYRLYVIEQKFPPTDLENRTKYVKEAINVLSELDEVIAAVYVDKVSEVAGVPKDSILSALKNKSKSGNDTVPLRKAVTETKPNAGVKTEERTADAATSGLVKAGRVVLMTFLLNESVSAEGFLERQMFANEDQRELFGYIVKERSRGENPSVSNVYDVFPESHEVAEVLNVFDGIEEFTAKKMFEESYSLLNSNLNKIKLAELSRQYNTVTDESEKEKIKAEMSKLLPSKSKR